MGLIQETINHPTIDGVDLEVDEFDKHEVRVPYKIISLDISNYHMSAIELIELGKWLIENGRRIKKEYSSKGKHKDSL